MGGDEILPQRFFGLLNGGFIDLNAELDLPIGHDFAAVGGTTWVGIALACVNVTRDLMVAPLLVEVL